MACDVPISRAAGRQIGDLCRNGARRERRSRHVAGRGSCGDRGLAADPKRLAEAGPSALARCSCRSLVGHASPVGLKSRRPASPGPRRRAESARYCTARTRDAVRPTSRVRRRAYALLWRGQRVRQRCVTRRQDSGVDCLAAWAGAHDFERSAREDHRVVPHHHDRFLWTGAKNADQVPRLSGPATSTTKRAHRSPEGEDPSPCPAPTLTGLLSPTSR